MKKEAAISLEATSALVDGRKARGLVGKQPSKVPKWA